MSGDGSKTPKAQRPGKKKNENYAAFALVQQALAQPFSKEGGVRANTGLSTNFVGKQKADDAIIPGNLASGSTCHLNTGGLYNEGEEQVSGNISESGPDGKVKCEASSRTRVTNTRGNYNGGGKQVIGKAPL